MGWFRRNQHDQEQLSAYLDGELSSRQAETVESHVASCPECAALLDELREMQSLVSALPSRTPRRSFVLGAEHARAPAPVTAAPPRRFGFAMAAPAAALTLFVALVGVDLIDFSSSASDSSETALTASAIELEQGASAGGVGGGVAEPAAAQNRSAGDDAANSTADGTAAASAEAPAVPPSPGEAAGLAPQATDGGANFDADPSTNGQGRELAITADTSVADEAGPAAAPVEAPSLKEDGDGSISTLRWLQIAAAAAFIVSGFYVFVWPRWMKRGS